MGIIRVLVSHSKPDAIVVGSLILYLCDFACSKSDSQGHPLVISKRFAEHKAVKY